jgi:NitT/TauT family transport system permease protein
MVLAKFVNPLFLASPAATAKQMYEMGKDGTLWSNTWVTLQVALVGFAIGMTSGIILGYLIAINRRVLSVVNPFVTILNSMPLIAFAPLLILWFGLGFRSGVALVSAIVVFIALRNTIEGTSSVERNYVIMARLAGASRWSVISRIIFPATTPWLFAAARISLAFALTGAVVSEMFLGQAGLGYLIVAGGGVFNISTVFTAIVTTMVCAYILENLMSNVERWTLRWRPPAAHN